MRVMPVSMATYRLTVVKASRKTGTGSYSDRVIIKASIINCGINTNEQK